MSIVDSNGQPITAEIASIERDINRTFYGKRMTNGDDTLIQRGGAKGLKIYQELKRDAHAGAVLAKRKLAVTSRPWSVEPATEDAREVEAASLVQKAFEHLRFNAACKRMLEATLQGFSVVEVMWEVRGGQWLPARLLARDARRFTFTTDGELRLLTREAPLLGEELPPRKFIVHRCGADDDSPYGLGLGSMLFWPVFFKRQSITFWLTFADKFGSPTAVGKYPGSAGKTEQAKLLSALAALSQDAGVIVPEGMMIELLEAQRSGSVDTYERLVRYMDEQISKAVLGETMSTTAAPTGLGSNQASVQNDVRLELAEDDADELNETINDTLIRWIIEFNLGEGVGLPKLCREFDEPEDLVARAQRDKQLSDMGWEPSEEYMLETYGPGWTKKAPAPNPFGGMGGGGFGGFGVDPGGQDSTATAYVSAGNDSTNAATTDDPASAFAEGLPLKPATSQRAFNAVRQQALFDASEQLASQWNALMGKRVQDITARLEQDGDLIAFRESLDALMHETPNPATVETIARATFAAQIMGRGLNKTPPKGWLAKLKSMVKKA